MRDALAPSVSTPPTCAFPLKVDVSDEEVAVIKLKLGEYVAPIGFVPLP